MRAVRFMAVLACLFLPVAACGARTMLASDAEAADAGPDTSTAPIDAGVDHPSDVHVRDSGLPYDAQCPPGKTETPLYLEFIVDGSGSMEYSGKWPAAVLALDAMIDAFSGDPNVAMGLIVFADEEDGTFGSGPYPGPTDVPIAFVDDAQNARLHQRIDGTQPKGGTPTLRALHGAYKTLDGYAPAPPTLAGGQRAVVVLTDGIPNGSLGEQNQCVQAATQEKNLLTFVIGVGPFPVTPDSTYDPLFLGQLAVAGRTARPNCVPTEDKDVTRVCYQQVTPGGVDSKVAKAFLDAIQYVRDVGGCR